MSALPSLGRRPLLLAAGLLCLQTRPASAVSATLSLQQMVDRWAEGQPVREGKISLEIAELVENGNAVPITVRVDSAMNATDRVQEIIVFNERNPQRDVLRASFGLPAAAPSSQPASGSRPRSSWWPWPGSPTAASGRTVST